MNGPQAPDPWETASAQGKWNNTTAQTQQALNMVDQHSAWGSSVYDQTGSQTIIGADGQPINVPKYSQTTTLSPEQQAIFDQSQQAQGNLAGLANDQSAAMRDYLNTPFQFNNSDAEQWAYDLASPRLLAQQGQNEATLRATLANKGIREGSAAWDAEMNRLTQGNTDQLNQLALTGRGQAFQEAAYERANPINEISSLMSGSQVSMPQFGATPQTGVAGVDYTGLVNQKYQADLKSSQGMMGGLFGLGGSILGAAGQAGGFGALFSDRRLKSNIRRVGTLDNGLAVYSYTMDGGPVQIGVMADEVEAVRPDAVIQHPSGFLMVDYGMATEAA